MAVIEAIATTYLEADVATVLFEGIPTTYEHLQLRMNIATDSTYASGVYRDFCFVYFNTSTATTNSDYSWHAMYGRASTPAASSGTGSNYITIPHCAGTSLGVAHFGTTVVDILDYRNGSKNTTTSSPAGSLGPGTGTGEMSVGFSSGLWDAVTAVDKILLIPDLGSNFRRGSEFTLYGLNSS
jgi:hypothetical protein